MKTLILLLYFLSNLLYETFKFNYFVLQKDLYFFINFVKTDASNYVNKVKTKF